MLSARYVQCFATIGPGTPAWLIGSVVENIKDSGVTYLPVLSGV